jgi:hypothetical protein
VHHQDRGYTILVFARPTKTHNHCTVPFVFSGPARHVSHHAKLLESPAWHKAALQETEKRFEEGQERVLDWQTAKKEMRKHFE